MIRIFRDTVDSIVSDIQNKIERLSAVAEAKRLEAEAHDAVIAERIKLASEARAVTVRAEAVAAKFAALIESV